MLLISDIFTALKNAGFGIKAVKVTEGGSIVTVAVSDPNETVYVSGNVNGEAFSTSIVVD